MDKSYWHKQTPAEPLYPDLLWSRPETKTSAGKLLIIGGNAHGFAAAAEAFAEAMKAGIGTARVLLPDSLQRTVGKTFEAGEYAPSTPSGSFSRKALSEFLAMAEWADNVLIAGDLGRNSETAIVLEEFTNKYDGKLTVTRDAADYFTKSPAALLQRPQTLLVFSFAQLQKTAIASRFVRAFTFDMDFLRLIDNLHEYSLLFPATFITKHLDNIFVAVNGEVSTTKTNDEQESWRVKTAAAASVWWLQNSTKIFEALSDSVYVLQK